MSGAIIGDVAGLIAKACVGIPDSLQETVFDYLDEPLSDYHWSYANELYGN